MNNLLLAGASALVLANQALAQPASRPPVAEAPSPNDQPTVPPTSAPSFGSDGSGLDTLVPADNEATAPAPALAPTGNPVLDRLNALETRVRQLEARNAQLEQQAELNQDRLQTVETRSAKQSQWGWAPSTSDTAGNFTFKPRGVIDADFAHFDERRGGYDYNDGTGFRRARLGFEGTAFKWFNYRLEVDFAGNVVTLTDAYVQYSKIPKLLLTVGQHKAPFGLESNNSDNYNLFLERGMFTNAFGNAGAERRIGVSAAWAPRETINVAGGVFGDNESVGRSTATSVTNTPDESWGFNGRATWEPLFDSGRIIHLGVASYYRRSLKSGDTADAVRLTERPNIRIDNGNIADSGVITGVRDLTYAGAEAAAVFGPFTAFGEAGRLWAKRPTLGDAHFTGAYAALSYLLTGETRPFKSGNFDRVRPAHELGKDGLGAFEVAARYDWLDLAGTPVGARAGNRARSLTLGLNWYLNPYLKLMTNVIHFWGDNTPLDPVGNVTKGDVLATRLHLDF
ncbi:porin [Sphingomonas ginkgonis]|nr:porin [Sphingomonas ginkgonis]